MNELTALLSKPWRLVLSLLVLGLGGGAGLAGTTYMLGLLEPQGAAATHDGSGTIHACVSLYTGEVRINLFSTNAVCGPGELPVDLGGSQPAAALNLEVRTTSTDIPTNVGGLDQNQVDCLPGEIAISGGSRVYLNGEQNVATWIEIDAGGGPVGSPPTGWRNGFTWETAPGLIATQAVETWVICMS